MVKASGELHDALSAAYAAIDPEDFPKLSARLSALLNCDSAGACVAYQASMDRAREEGRREERHACMAVAQAIAEKYGPTQQADRIETALNVRDMIAARGPMEE